MNPTLKAALKSLPVAILIALAVAITRMRNTLAAALIRRDEAINEAEGLRLSLTASQLAGVELQGEVDRARRERDAVEVRLGAMGELQGKIIQQRDNARTREGAAEKARQTQRERAEAAEKRVVELAKACERAATYIESAADLIRDGLDGDKQDDTAARRYARTLRKLAKGDVETPAPVEKSMPVGGVPAPYQRARVWIEASPKLPDPVERVDVVSAVIVRDGKLLLAKRSADRDFGGRWECSGGKVEDLETHVQALQRELREELGVTVQGDLLRLWSITFGPPDVRRPLRVTFFRVDIGDQVPRCLDADEIGWFSRDDVLLMSMTPGNEWFRKELAALCEPAQAPCAWCGKPSTNACYIGEPECIDVRLCHVCTYSDAITAKRIAERVRARQRLSPEAVREAGAEVSRDAAEES